MLRYIIIAVRPVGLIRRNAESEVDMDEEAVYSIPIVGLGWTTPKQVAKELGVDYKSVRDWMKRHNDPLPVRMPIGNSKQGRIFIPELNAWLIRNWTLMEVK